MAEGEQFLQDYRIKTSFIVNILQRYMPIYFIITIIWEKTILNQNTVFGLVPTPLTAIMEKPHGSLNKRNAFIWSEQKPKTKVLILNNFSYDMLLKYNKLM